MFHVLVSWKYWISDFCIFWYPGNAGNQISNNFFQVAKYGSVGQTTMLMRFVSKFYAEPRSRSPNTCIFHLNPKSTRKTQNIVYWHKCRCILRSLGVMWDLASYRSEGFPNGIFHPCALWARGLARWESCRRVAAVVVVGVTWKSPGKGHFNSFSFRA